MILSFRVQRHTQRGEWVRKRETEQWCYTILKDTQSQNFANGLHGTSHNCQTDITLHTLSSIGGEHTAENKRNTPKKKRRKKETRGENILSFFLFVNSSFIQFDRGFYLVQTKFPWKIQIFVFCVEKKNKSIIWFYFVHFCLSSVLTVPVITEKRSSSNTNRSSSEKRKKEKKSVSIRLVCCISKTFFFLFSSTFCDFAVFIVWVWVYVVSVYGDVKC